jgi:hypothetical protein
MPTTLPLRFVESQSDDGLASFCRMLVRFYVLLALVLLSLTAIEMYLGMYSGKTAPKVILRSIETAPTL